jgi:hypothetical protein
MSAYQNLLSILIQALGWQTVLFMAIIGAVITSGISLWLLIELATCQHQAGIRLSYTWKRDKQR